MTGINRIDVLFVTYSVPSLNGLFILRFPMLLIFIYFDKQDENQETISCPFMFLASLLILITVFNHFAHTSDQIQKVKCCSAILTCNLLKLKLA